MSFDSVETHLTRVDDIISGNVACFTEDLIAEYAQRNFTASSHSSRMDELAIALLAFMSRGRYFENLLAVCNANPSLVTEDSLWDLVCGVMFAAPVIPNGFTHELAPQLLMDDTWSHEHDTMTIAALLHQRALFSLPKKRNTVIMPTLRFTSLTPAHLMEALCVAAQLGHDSTVKTLVNVIGKIPGDFPELAEEIIAQFLRKFDGSWVVVNAYTNVFIILRNISKYIPDLGNEKIYKAVTNLIETCRFPLMIPQLVISITGNGVSINSNTLPVNARKIMLDSIRKVDDSPQSPSDKENAEFEKEIAASLAMLTGKMRV